MKLTTDRESLMFDAANAILIYVWCLSISHLEIEANRISGPTGARFWIQAKPVNWPIFEATLTIHPAFSLRLFFGDGHSNQPDHGVMIKTRGRYLDYF